MIRPNSNALAGPQDDAAAYLVKQLVGGQGSASAQKYAAETLSLAGQMFVKTPEGKSTLSSLTWYGIVPAALLGLAVGFYMGRR